MPQQSIAQRLPLFLNVAMALCCLAATPSQQIDTPLLTPYEGDPGEDDLRRYSAIHLYSGRYANKAKVEQLLSTGARPDTRDSGGETPLHKAAAFGQVEIIKLLLKHGADINATDRWGDTPLLEAAAHHQTLAVKLLLDSGAKPDVPNSSGRTPLYLGLNARHITAMLRQRDVKLDIHIAARLGDAALVRHFLDKDPKLLSAKDSRFNGKTPLHWAVSGKHLEVVRLLLDRGADANSRTDNGDTPLRLAALSDNNVPSVIALLERGADVHLAPNGTSPLHTAALIDAPEMARLLCKHGHKLDRVDDDGDTPLHYAARYGSPKVTAVLLELGANPAARNKEGKTPRDLAEESFRFNPDDKDDAEVVRILREHRALPKK